MLVSRMTSDPVPVPGEAEAFFSFCLITPNQLQSILDERQRKSMKKMNELGDSAAQIVREIAEARAKAPAPVVPEPTTPQPPPPKPTDGEVVSQYDRTMLLLAGIKSWKGGCYEGVELNAINVDDLDWKTSYWAARSILEYNKLLPGQDELGN
ncbi:MAG: hypothetical protein ABFD60_01585 [Bryobacteraceae bacterium]